MKHSHYNKQVTALLLLATILINVTPCLALNEDEVKNDLKKAYEAVAKAEAAGGDVHTLIRVLDDAAIMIPGASELQLSEAQQLINTVQTKVPEVEIEGAQRITNRLYLTALSLLIIAALIIIVWKKGSAWFWNTWLKSHKGWRVEQT